LTLLLAPAAAPGQEPTVDEARRAIETALTPSIQVAGEPVPAYSLEERMADHGVPGVSVAVVHVGRIHWAAAYGMADVEEGRPVTTETLFQAASISKPVAALAALQLVEEGRLELDADVNRYLESWKVPPSDAAGGEPVTIRRLVTHSAGLTVHGFRGYARGEPVPSTVEVLDGSGPANSAPVRVDIRPGERHRYSGGGYTVLQLLLADVLGRPFPDLMRERVLDPVGMTASTYRQPLPEALRDRAATGYRAGGSEVVGKWHTYPEMAAAGLWTTPSDLARYVLEVQRAVRGESDVLGPEMAAAMVTPGVGGWGLGPGLDGEGDARRFSHGGANEGFRAVFFGSVSGGEGAAVMTNSDTGGALYTEIVRALARVYGWSGWEARVIDEVALGPDGADAFAGTYEVQGMDLVVRVEAVGSRLRLQVPGRPAAELVHVGDDAFVDVADGTRLRFERNDAGEVEAIRQGNLRAVRSEGATPPRPW
jgi:CubicO group peptidase (beta-lactamase class C family)